MMSVNFQKRMWKRRNWMHGGNQLQNTLYMEEIYKEKALDLDIKFQQEGESDPLKRAVMVANVMKSMGRFSNCKPDDLVNCHLEFMTLCYSTDSSNGRFEYYQHNPYLEALLEFNSNTDYENPFGAYLWMNVLDGKCLNYWGIKYYEMKTGTEFDLDPFKAQRELQSLAITEQKKKNYYKDELFKLDDKFQQQAEGHKEESLGQLRHHGSVYSQQALLHVLLLAWLVKHFCISLLQDSHQPFHWKAVLGMNILATHCIFTLLRVLPFTFAYSAAIKNANQQIESGQIGPIILCFLAVSGAVVYYVYSFLSPSWFVPCLLKEQPME